LHYSVEFHKWYGCTSLIGPQIHSFRSQRLKPLVFNVTAFCFKYSNT